MFGWIVILGVTSSVVGILRLIDYVRDDDNIGMLKKPGLRICDVRDGAAVKIHGRITIPRDKPPITVYRFVAAEQFRPATAEVLIDQFVIDDGSGQASIYTAQASFFVIARGWLGVAKQEVILQSGDLVAIRGVARWELSQSSTVSYREPARRLVMKCERNQPLIITNHPSALRR